MKTVHLLAIFLFISVDSLAQTLEWARSFGSESWDEGLSITVDAFGNIYTIGDFGSTIDFDPGPGVVNLTATGLSTNTFIQKLNSSGNLVWAKSFQGTEGARGRSLKIDALGNVYTAGFFSGKIDFNPGAGKWYLTSQGQYDAFIQKLDSSGNFVWAKSFGGSLNEAITDIAIDKSGNVYTTGSFTGTTDFNPSLGATTYLTSAGKNAVFVQKLDAFGNLVWVKALFVGGPFSSIRGGPIALGESGSIYITGSFMGTVDFDPGPGTFNLTSSGQLRSVTDFFVLKLNRDGDFLWAKSFGGECYDNSLSLAVDAKESVYITGGFCGRVDFDPSQGIAVLASGSVNDPFVLKLDASGDFVWAKSFYCNYAYGNAAGASGESIAIDSLGNVYTTGYLFGTVDFDPGPGTFNVHSDPYGAFIHKLDTSGNFEWVKTFGTHSGNAEGKGIAVDAFGNVYTTGFFQETVYLDSKQGVISFNSVGDRDIYILKLNQCLQSEINIVNWGNVLSIKGLDLSATYQWLDCGNNYLPISNETSQTFEANSNGYYAVEITLNNCVDTSACFAITTVGVDKFADEMSISVLPNPTEGQVQVLFKKPVQNVVLRLTDIHGRLIFNQHYQELNGTSLNLPETSGIYFLTVITRSRQQQFKLFNK